VCIEASPHFYPAGPRCINLVLFGMFSSNWNAFCFPIFRCMCLPRLPCVCVCVCVYLFVHMGVRHATDVKLTKNNTSSVLRISLYLSGICWPHRIHIHVSTSTYSWQSCRCGFMYGELTDKETVGRLEYTLENQQQDQFEILLYKKNSEYALRLP